jgi:hypothetical protein
MIEKGLMVIMFMYAVSFSALTVQWMLEPADITIRNADGDELKSSVIAIINNNTFNQASFDIANPNQTNLETNPVLAAGAALADLLLLLTGTYIFSILVFFGVPVPFVVGLVGLYIFLLARLIIGYARGI